MSCFLGFNCGSCFGDLYWIEWNDDIYWRFLCGFVFIFLCEYYLFVFLFICNCDLCFFLGFFWYLLCFVFLFCLLWVGFKFWLIRLRVEFLLYLMWMLKVIRLYCFLVYRCVLSLFWLVLCVLMWRVDLFLDVCCFVFILLLFWCWVFGSRSRWLFWVMN